MAKAKVARRVAKRNALPWNEVQRLLSYNKRTGVVVWRFTLRNRTGFNKAHYGQRAGSLIKSGYRTISVLGCIMPEHTLIWFLVTKAWPTDEVDHKNLRKNDNRWRNLREASHDQNTRNTPMRRTNRCGLKGVSKVFNRWIARIQFEGKQITLGRFDTKEQAHQAFCDASTKLHGEFSSHH